jgi:hypothetical protein
MSAHSRNLVIRIDINSMVDESPCPGLAIAKFNLWNHKCLLPLHSTLSPGLLRHNLNPNQALVSATRGW